MDGENWRINFKILCDFGAVTQLVEVTDYSISSRMTDLAGRVPVKPVSVVLNA
jgi:hypothetical protein